MKKYLFIILFVLTSSAAIQAQCVVDTTIKTKGIYPRILPQAKEDSVYDQTIQFKMPKDTQSILGLVVYDSITITNITNVPKGINYICNTNPGFSACTWAGGSNGCMTVTGTPEIGTYGKHFCIATLRAYVVINAKVTYFETKDTLVLMVNAKNGNNGIENQLSKSVNLHTYPTPFDNHLQLEISSTIASPISIELINTSGQVMTTQQGKINPGASKFELNTTNLPQGFYLLKLQTLEGTQIVKILK